MQLKNSIVLLTALTAGSAMARLHGHERRHQHQERGVGTWVTAVIDGKTVSWQNTYAGPTAAPEAPAAAPVADVANNVVQAVAPTAAPSANPAPSNTNTATGFGGTTAPKGSGATFCGNVGVPYGSNMIEIAQDELSKFDYTITLDGSNISEDYNVIFWNKCDANGALTGFFGPTFPLTVKVSPGAKSYVAVDSNTQGGFVGYPASESVPRNAADGIVLGYWGEFDFADSNNSGWSGFDVSAIEAQIAQNVNFPGLHISGNGQASGIASSLKTVTNAYLQKDTDVGGIGGNVAPGPVALTAILNYSG